MWTGGMLKSVEAKWWYKEAEESEAEKSARTWPGPNAVLWQDARITCDSITQTKQQQAP